jgi:TolA-binding protein
MSEKNETTQAESTTAESAKRGLGQVETFLKAQLAVAQKRIEELEGEAQKVLKTVETRGQEAAKEAQVLWGKLQEGTLLMDPRVVELGKKVDAAGTGLKKRLDGLQTKVVEAVGVASQAQLKDLNKELAKLTRKVDALLKPMRRGSSTKAANGSADEKRV